MTRKSLYAICATFMVIGSACNRAKEQASSAASPVERNATTVPDRPQAEVANEPRVTLAFDHLDLQDIVPFLTEVSGKAVTISPQFNSAQMRPTYRLTLKSPEVMTVQEAYTRVLAKLRSDGLDVRETPAGIDIHPGNYLNVWKP